MTATTTTLPRAAFAYERVSTARQTADQQRTANAVYAATHGLPIIITRTDTASGATPWRDRAISQATNRINGVTDVIVYELSRIGRDLADTLDFMRAALEAGITLHVSRTGLRIGAGIDGKIMATVLGLAADIEREFLRTRTRDALAERRALIKEQGGFTSASGVYRTALGRPKGPTNTSKLDEHAPMFRQLAAAGASDAMLARLFKVSRQTIARFRAIEKRRTTSSTNQQEQQQ